MSCHEVLSAQGRSSAADAPGSHLRLGPDRRNVGVARDFVRSALVGQTESILYDAAWLTSELVANAIVHAETDFIVGVRADAGEILVTVTDPRHDRIPHVGHMPSADDVVEMSRGIALVCAVATDFGWKLLPNGDGKVVWFTLVVD
jgi:anti-sigma regulatory factor (Ser/Thr protein kinase)